MSFRPGMSCPICHRPILSDEARVSFPPFERNQKSVLFPLSGGTAHEACYQTWEERPAVEYRLAAHDEFDRREKVCAACGETISAREGYYTPAFLTEDKTNPLYLYNYVTLHWPHLEGWNDYAKFRQLVEQMQTAESWQSWNPVLPNTKYNMDPERQRGESSLWRKRQG